jgi:hypothetical protein
MNKTELKNFAISARRDLLEKVALRAKLFGIDEKSDLKIDEKFGQLAINGDTYSIDKKSAFLSLKKQLEIKGYEQLIEEVAYTWFNRIIAIRYMEVNEYLPERVKVLSSSTGKVEPDILSEFETMDLDIDAAKIRDLVRQGATEESYRQLFIAQCNALNPILPFMFEKINDYTELLLPDFLLDSESVINKLVSNEELTDSFKEVEVIGWLYQFYNTEPKDRVFANLKKNKKIEKYDIPSATQLFTPKWIVQYMVENSLGQLWLESNPDSSLKESMRYYIEPAEQDEDVKKKIEEIRYKNVNLEEITIIDPCVGSGHILVFAFDLLYRMYEEAGYPIADIPQLILEKNLFGLDIDDRAAQLASFSLIMKAKEKNRRIFKKNIELNIFSIQESNELNREGFITLICRSKQEIEEVELIIKSFINCKNIGSILQPPNIDIAKYLERINQLSEEQLSTENYLAYEQLDEFKLILKLFSILSSKYDIAITNPPYMGAKGLNVQLSEYLKEKYPTSKTDLFAVFIERLNEFTKNFGFNAMINQHSWMFLNSFEKLREKVLTNFTILSMIHLGPRAFEEISGEIVQSTTYILRKVNIMDYRCQYFRLVNLSDSQAKQEAFLLRNNNFIKEQKKYLLMPGKIIAYWTSRNVDNLFKGISLKDVAEAKSGLSTADDNRYLRLWHEVPYLNITFNKENKKWVPYTKGGSYRKWYGNNEYVVNWLNNGEMLKNFKNSVIRNPSFYFRKGLTWATVTSHKSSFRFTPTGFIYGNKGNGLFVRNEDDLLNLLGLLNSKVVDYLLKIIAPTISLEAGYVSNIPLNNIDISRLNLNSLVSANVKISKADWDAFETSWDFIQHPFLTFIKDNKLLEDVFFKWETKMNLEFNMIKTNEEEINKIIINLYEIKNELNYKVSEEDITIRKADRNRDSKSFLSYIIGCVMGRYSLDTGGLVFASGEWDDYKYNTFKPNEYGLIQLTDEHYFENDILARLREFLSVTFGEETVEENLQWLAESLELKRNETAEERLRRYFQDEFFKDHCQMYQKRPIYWLIDSGKEKGLRTLIYMHRYKPDTMATIRFEHLQEIQAKYNNEIAAVDLRIVNPNLSATEKRELEKRKTVFQKRLDELLEFDKKLAEYANAQIEIDLDDGVKLNYAKFDKILAKIK